MHHDFLDRYSRIVSPIHQIPAPIKMFGAFCIIAAVISVPIHFVWFFIILTTGLIVIGALSNVPKLFLLRRLIFLEPFVAGVAILAFFRENGGLVFATIVIRSSLSLVTILLLTNTTPFAEMLQVLKRFHISPTFITILALMYRYLFILVDETERMQRARLSRSFNGKKISKWNMLSIVIGQLFIRSSERAERIYAAMCARGWK
jgi:cobalt/nickel transport system permease protein